jgi:hypothetical protein
MYPNTINSVELMGYFSDEAEECRLQGQDVPTPWMFTIPKGEHLEVSDHGWACLGKRRIS